MIVIIWYTYYQKLKTNQNLQKLGFKVYNINKFNIECLIKIFVNRKSTLRTWNLPSTFSSWTEFTIYENTFCNTW